MAGLAHQIDMRFSQPAVLPVVHVVDEEQTIRNVARAVEAGADGVFIIDYATRLDAAGRPLLRKVNQTLRAEFGDYWLGVNLLGHSAVEAYLELDQAGWEVNALWDDAAPISFGGVPHEIMNLQNFRAGGRIGQIKYFGGIAHKGSGYTDHPGVAARLADLAAPYLDVVVTTGPGTGRPIGLDKVMAMEKELAGRRPLAIASGVSQANVEQLLPYIDAIMVASSIETSPMSGEFDDIALHALVREVRRLAAVD
ncbi:hypothetical protein HY346_03235 [Candidatus Microgenomates bacterium]|nr:hypothetical protein [Candidatus Microgenomates bacterium]